ncbi:hypothetical protein V9T40_007583 [Parthenolecanium corni]|uniref:Putative sodium-coupled neutral amino acid transporter 11 n=1 Tax=Parthenolecanium corni TaxID=536013 RepID=A0AAN9TLX6_9HEMI
MSIVSTLPDERSYILEARKGAIYFTNQDEKLPKKSDYKFAVFNYINCIVGSGVIGIPYAFREAGFGAGLVLLLGISFITDYSLKLMIECAHLTNAFTYQGIMEAAYGRKGFLFLSLLQFIYPFIAMVSYNIIVGDTLTKVMVRLFDVTANSIFVRRDFVIGIATLFITSPLCLMKNLVGLARASVLSFFLILFIMATFFVRIGSMATIVPRSDDAFKFLDPKVFTAFGIMAFSFMCHHNVFLLYDSIENVNQKKWDRITMFSVSVSSMILCLFGIAGYVTFTGFTQGDVFKNYCWDDDLINFAGFAFSFTVLFAFPIECMTARSVITQLLGPINHELTVNEHVCVTLFLVLTTYLISITTSCLGAVLELNGIVSAIPLAFVLPALIYIKLIDGPFLSGRKLRAFGLAVFGVIVAIVGCFMLLTRWSKYATCDQGREPFYCEASRNSDTT